MLEDVPIIWFFMIVLGWIMGITIFLLLVILHLGILIQKTKY